MAGKKMKISNAIASSPSDVDWQIRDDFRTLCSAKEIENDPKRMGKVKEYAKQQMMECASIATEIEGGE